MLIDKLEELGLKILEKIGLKKFANWYREHKEGMRYLVFGGLSTILNIFVFAICAKYIKISTTISNTIAWIVTVLFAYITNKLYVFNSKTTKIKKLAKEIISFFSARIITLVLETAFLWIVIDKLEFNEILMKISSNIIVIILNFVFSKIFIFKNDKK